VLNSIISFALQRRLLMMLLALAVLLAGLWSFQRLPIDAFPDTSPVLVQVNTVAPSLGPQDIETQITYPVEQVLGGLPGLREVRSLSKFGLSQVTALFADGTDILRARQLVKERLDNAELPEMAGVQKPELGPIATGLGEVYHYLVSSDQVNGKDRYDLTELRTIHHWLVKSQLRTVPGVAEVNSWGGYEKQYHVLFDPSLLAKYDLTLGDVVDSLRTNNGNVGGGNVQQADQVSLIQGVGMLTSSSDIAGIVLKHHEGQPVRVNDVAQVEINHEIQSGAVTTMGRGQVILGLGFMLLGENSRAVTERMRAKMEEIKKTLPPGVIVEEALVRTTLVDKVLETAKDNLFHGAILVVAALFILGGGLRAGLIVAVSIPLSFLFATSMMLQVGIAGSLMSLGAIDFGIIVDSSVIMVENSVRHLGEAHPGRSATDVVRDACVEVRKPTMFGELIIMIVYLPILTLEGVEGKLFRPMAETVLFALLGSLILSMTVMPALASWFLPRRAEDREPWVVRKCQAFYRPVLTWVLAHRFHVVFLAAAILATAGIVATELGTEFIPRLSEHAIVIATQRLASITLDEAVRHGTVIEQQLLQKFPDEIERIWTRHGTAEVATDPMGWDQGDVFIILTPAEKWTKAKTQDQLVERMKEEVNGVPGIAMMFTQPIEQRINEMIAGIREDIGIRIFGDDFGQLVKLAEQVADELRSIDGASDVGTDQVAGLPVLRIEVDQDAISRYGIPRRDVLSTIQALGTPRVGEVREGQRRFPIVVRLAEQYRKDPDAIGQILVLTPVGARLPLARLARIEKVETPSVIFREWAKRRMLVQCNVRGRDVGSFVAEARQRIERLSRSWPAGYHATWGGQFEHMERAQRRLMFVVPLAGLLIFILLYATFNSVRDALLIYSCVPFAVVGGVIALYLRGMPFSISAGVGFVALLGIAVLNGLVLVSYIHKLVGLGRPLDQAVFEAGVLRLRPVLMTSATAALGFVPMMLATAIGAEVQRPLATVVVGGIISSLLLTLLVFPALYSLFGRPHRGDGEAA
jgi:cobalt-zinc-cadmium resistance protein CzcA